MKRASIISRILANLIDTYLVLFIMMILLFSLLHLIEENLILTVIVVLFFILFGIASFLFKDVVDGRSIGKRIFSIGVRNLDGSIPDVKKLINRNLTTSWFWPKDIYNLLFSSERRKQGDIANETDVYQVGNTNNKLNKFLRIIISIIMIGVFISFGFIFMIKNDASYKEAVKYIENDTRIQEIVGDDMSIGFFPSGSISRSNGFGEASFKIKVSGEKGSLSVFILLEKEPNEKWKTKKIIY